MSDLTTQKKEEEDKGAGAAPWMTGTARVGTGLSSGTSGGAGGALARLFAALAGPKLLVLGTVLGGLALGMGVVSTIEQPKEPSLSQRFSGARMRTDAPASALPGSEQPGPSALNMAQQANSGFYGDGSAAAPAAAPADTSKSDPKVDAPADPASAGAKAGDPATAGDPAALAAALTAKEGSKARLANTFGKLSSGFGGGSLLAGGAGLSGGIGGQFKQPLTNSRAGQLQAMAGAQRAKVSRAMTPSRNLGNSAFNGANARRLDQMNRAMGRVGTSAPDAAAATHAEQWDAATPTGNAITGGGASGISSGGQFSGDEGMGNGSPLSQPSSGGSYQPNTAPSTGQGSNQTPYQGQLDMARGLLLLASMIITVIGFLAVVSDTPFTVELKSLQGILLMAALGMGAAAAAIGASIGSKYGQQTQGMMIGVGGAITAAAAGAAMAAPSGTTAWLLVLGGLAGMAAGIFSGGGGKLANHQQLQQNVSGGSPQAGGQTTGG